MSKTFYLYGHGTEHTTPLAVALKQGETAVAGVASLPHDKAETTQDVSYARALIRVGSLIHRDRVGFRVGCGLSGPVEPSTPTLHTHTHIIPSPTHRNSTTHQWLPLLNPKTKKPVGEILVRSQWVSKIYVTPSGTNYLLPFAYLLLFALWALSNVVRVLFLCLCVCVCVCVCV